MGSDDPTPTDPDERTLANRVLVDFGPYGWGWAQVRANAIEFDDEELPPVCWIDIEYWDPAYIEDRPASLVRLDSRKDAIVLRNTLTAMIGSLDARVGPDGW